MFLSKSFSTTRLLPLCAIAALAAMGAVFGCAGGAKPATTADAGGKSGSQLWADNCGRCHNTRSPAAYSDAQWATVMQHMRVAANIPGEDARKIETFLKAAN